MAGRHRKRSRLGSSVARVAAPGGIAAAAVCATSVTTAFITGTAPALTPAVELMALVTPANSTSQFFAGTTYYGTDYTKEGYGPQEVVPFFLGPQGIADAIRQSDSDTRGTIVLASGWGAGQTGTALATLSPSERGNIDLVILDNNSNRAGGGFWTTYALFAPLLLTSAEPTPSNLGIPILDVGYEYNINGNAPTDPLNPFALGNSLAAYVYGYGAEQTAEIPQNIIDEAKNPAGPHFHYVLNSKGEIVGEPTPLPQSTTTYVTFEAENLPMLRPLRLLPGGDIVADALEPTMTELVDAGYQDGNSIPTDPRVPQPMTPFSSINNLDGVPGSVREGSDDGVDSAQDDLSTPTNIVTKPLGESRKLPVLSSLSPDAKKTGTTSSTDYPRPLKKIADNVRTSLRQLAGGDEKDNPAKSENPE